MASLTDQLDLASSSRRIIDPQNNKGPTFLEGLANFGKNLVEAGSDNFRQSQARQRQADADRKAANKDAAENAAAEVALRGKMGQYDTDTQAPSTTDQADLPDVEQYIEDPNPWGQPVPFDAELEGAPLPPDVTRIVQDVSRAQRAETQGRAPAGSGRIRLEAAVEDLMARYPDQITTIYKTFKEAGLDHYLFRQSELDENQFKVDMELDNARRKAQYDAAVKAGLPAQIMDGPAVEEAGRQILEAEYQTAQLKAKREEERAQSAEGRAQSEHTRSETDRESVRLYMDRASAGLDPVLNALMGRIGATGYMDSAGQIQDVQKLQTAIIPSMVQYYDGLISDARANGFTAAADALVSEKDRRIKSVQDAFTGDSAAFEVKKRFFDAAKTEMGMSIMESMPVYSFLTQAFGQGFINNEFVSVRQLIGQEAMDSLMQEMKGFDGFIDSDAERLSVVRLARAMADEAEFKRLPESQARQVISTSATVHHRGATAAVSDPTGNSGRAHLNSGFRLTDAALSLQPGMPSDVFNRNVPSAAGALFSQNSLQADKAVFNANNMDGRALILGKRAAAQNILQVSRGSAVSQPLAEQGWSVQYATVNGVPAFRPVLNRTAYNRWAQQQTRVAQAAAGAAGGVLGAQLAATQRGAPTYEEALANVPKELRDRSGSMELSMRYLMETNTYDEALQGISANDARSFFATGVLPQSMIDRRTEATQTNRVNTSAIDDQIVKSFQELGQSTQNAANETRQTTANVREAINAGQNFFQSKGWQPHQVAGILGNLQAESNFNTTIPGDGGKAKGLAQWHPDRRANAERNGFNLSNLNEAMAFVQWELENTESAAAQRLRAARTVEEAADAFALYFLRPAGAQTGVADNVHNIRGRRANARAILNG